MLQGIVINPSSLTRQENVYTYSDGHAKRPSNYSELFDICFFAELDTNILLPAFKVLPEAILCGHVLCLLKEPLFINGDHKKLKTKHIFIFRGVGTHLVKSSINLSSGLSLRHQSSRIWMAPYECDR